MISHQDFKDLKMTPWKIQNIHVKKKRKTGKKTIFSDLV